MATSDASCYNDIGNSQGFWIWLTRDNTAPRNDPWLARMSTGEDWNLGAGKLMTNIEDSDLGDRREWQLIAKTTAPVESALELTMWRVGDSCIVTGVIYGRHIQEEVRVHAVTIDARRIGSAVVCIVAFLHEQTQRFGHYYIAHALKLVSLNRQPFGCVTSPRKQFGDMVGFWMLS